MGTASILVVDDEKNIGRTLRMVLSDEGHEVESVESAEAALELLKQRDFDLLLLDVQLGGMSGLSLLEHLGKTDLGADVIMMSGHASLSDAVKATRLGAYDFLEKPIDRERLLLTVHNCLEKRKLLDKVRQLEDSGSDELGMVGESEAMRRVRSAVEVVAPTKGKVLILGESGVGKDLVARAIHQHSDRANKPYVKVNCSAIPSELIESELFGHEKGAFTGAGARRRGFFEQADGGTIFLDEIGDMSLAAQAKVLRVLQNGEISRVGSEKLNYVDVRVIAATNKHLEEEVKAERFRGDLYFRLNVVPITVPALRERLEDVPLLTHWFLQQISKEYGREVQSVSEKAMSYLCRYDYPGNIRELRNLCERFVIMASDPIDVGDLPDDIVSFGGVESGDDIDVSLSGVSVFEPGSKSLRDFRILTERAYIEATLQANQWNVSKTSEVLGMERTNLHKKIRKYGLEREE